MSFALQLSLDGFAPLSNLGGHKCARRDMTVNIGMVQRVQLHPQHIGLEDQRIANGCALFRRLGVFLDIDERKSGIARRLLYSVET